MRVCVDPRDVALCECDGEFCGLLYTCFARVSALSVAPWGLVALGGGANVPTAVLAIDLPDGTVRVIKASQVCLQCLRVYVCASFVECDL